ncbi:transcriptional regulator [Brevibacillus agri]|uniref:ImmA/IrrE family metallo-endopeptidase n=1 Tax=Brevibacillus agri TaxID=51101 RepID=A0A3M8A318_9BACL|nr:MULTISPECIES: XRE family transcriptional regulator [Brevibacillus]MCC0567051.1 XRE family transcriptional regulator [Brevibacillus borstelensis]MED1850100.1 XRE family transcriptional regulator [Brevibacillus borstelensis]QAV11526.1 ImmA/IrrE family metallo-endopeptidase [Brevibacillus agri]QHZ58885.1 ImmA/IrrE family metallo-endopeptidase [Brevibacillus sp. NSP2.1]RNB45603.1 ImmA/IrrE family metallo-endopeptidase [Brevibacillus agri]
MNVKQEPQFNPKRLREARLVRGMTISDLAEKIGISKQAISQFELGEHSPKHETVLALINTLKFPKNFFYREFKEQYVGNTFFRANATATKKSKEVQFQKTLLAGYIYEYLSEYIEFPELNVPDSSLCLNSEWNNNSIEQLAEQVRKHWDLGDKPITNIVHLLERNGVIVFSVDTDSEKVDAFCQHRKGRPFIFLGNDKQSAFRRQFDGAHELGHILMHKEIDNQDVLSRIEFKEMENQANRFASALLLPAEAFAKTVTSTSLLHFVELKKYWNVSIAAMLYRCLDLKLIDESKYTSLVKQMSMKKMRTKEPLDDVFPLQEPVVLRKSILMLLENKIKNELQLIQEISVPQEYIEMLCNLDQGTLNYKEPEPTIRLIKR